MDGEQQRTAILEAIRESTDGLDTAQVAGLVGLHPNTVRWHLSQLEKAGLLRSAPEHRARRGRPAIVYRLTAEGVVVGRDEYRLLAMMLTDTLARDSSADGRAYESGVRWGRHLHEASPRASVAQLLDQEGFAAAETDDRIEMRRCPFYALAEGAPQVICSLHRGIIDGALEASAAGQRVDRLDPFVEPTLCIAQLGPVPTSRPSQPEAETPPAQGRPRRGCPAPTAR